MRLLLDEMYSARIARSLRERGHDAAAVAERLDLRGASDEEVFLAAIQERRALVTDNVVDLRPTADRHVGDDKHHYGLIVTTHRAFPRQLVGPIIVALDLLLSAHPADAALADEIVWLDRATR